MRFVWDGRHRLEVVDAAHGVDQVVLIAERKKQHFLEQAAREVIDRAVLVDLLDRRDDAITSTASPGDKVPAAQAVRTADEALSASETPSIFGRSNTTGRSRLGGSTRSRQSRNRPLSDNEVDDRLKAALNALGGHRASLLPQIQH